MILVIHGVNYVEGFIMNAKKYQMNERHRKWGNHR